MCKVLKKITHFAKQAAPAIIGGLVLGPAGAGLASSLGGAAIGSGVGALASGKGVQGALLSGLGTYAGGSIGGSLFGNTVGDTLGSSASNAVGGAEAGLGNLLGTGFSQSASNSLLNSSVGGLAGSYAGNKIAANMIPNQQGMGSAQKSTSLLPTPADPTQSPQLDLPGSLSGLSGLDPNQQASNIATKGVYGGGNGPQEQSYFTNLVNRQLIDKSGKVSDISSLSPIENSYLKQLGLSGYSNSKDLLGAISKWSAA